jgi:hypothetical protein
MLYRVILKGKQYKWTVISLVMLTIIGIVSKCRQYRTNGSAEEMVVAYLNIMDSPA